MIDPDVYCEQKAAESGSSFYASFRFLPPPRRRAITALYAFCREADDVVDETTDAGVARMKLAWWRSEIAAAFGSGTPQHPVARALQPVIATFALPQSHFQEIIDGMLMDLDQNRYEDFATLERYCHRVAGVVGLMSADDLGIAFQLTNIIRDVGEDARRDRIYLPQDELARFGVSSSDILAQRSSPAFERLMNFQVQRARAFYAKALNALPAQDRRAQRPGLIMAAIYRRLLDKIEHAGFRVLDLRIALTPLRKAWIAWTTSWSY